MTLQKQTKEEKKKKGTEGLGIREGGKTSGGNKGAAFIRHVGVQGGRKLGSKMPSRERHGKK